MVYDIVETSNIYKELIRDLQEVKGSFVKVGFPSGAKPGPAKKSSENKKPYSDISEVAQVAIWNEFGVPMKSRVKKLGATGTAGRYLSMQEKTAGLNRWNKGFWFIVPRPFFRTAIDRNKIALNSFIDKVAAQLILGRISPDDALKLIGEWMQGKIKKSITTGNWPQNAPSTKKRKGSTKPLIDTSQMRNTVTYTTHKAGERVAAEGSLVL